MNYNAKVILSVLAIIFAILSYWPGIPTLGLAVVLVSIANLI